MKILCVCRRQIDCRAKRHISGTELLDIVVTKNLSENLTRVEVLPLKIAKRCKIWGEFELNV